MPISREQLEKLVAEAQVAPEAPSQNGHAVWGTFTEFDIDDWMARHLPEAIGPEPWGQGGRRWKLKVCPFNPDHTNTAAFVVQQPSGAIAAGCRHNGCKGRDWFALRALKEPGYTVSRNGAGQADKTYKTDETDSSVGSVGFVIRSSEKIWPLPIEFRDFERPPFPTHALPAWLEAFVLAIATETQTPVDLAGLLCLSACATALARKIKVVPRQGWEEPVNLYVVVALPPAARKSVVFRAVAAPIATYEQEQVVEARPGIEKAKEVYEILEQRKKRARAQAVKEDHDGPGSMSAEAQRIAVELAGMRVPAEPRFVCDDVTPEKLSNLLFEQGGRMAILSAEGGIFGIMQGRYSQGVPNFEVFLKAHSGDELRVDRIGRPAEFVKDPALTIGLAVQPSVIRNVPPEFRERGLMGRCLYSLPPSGVGKRNKNPPLMPSAIAEEYHRNLTALLEIPFKHDAEPEPIRPTPEAAALLVEFLGYLEPRLDEEVGDLGHMGDWAGKLAGAVARIAALLHCADSYRYQTPWSFPMEEHTMERAIVIGDYLLRHALAAYGQMGASSVVDRARRMLRWLERHDRTEFTRRDMHHGAMNSDGTVADLEPALELLVDHGFVRPERVESPGLSGGRPSQIFSVSPRMTKPTEPT